MRASGGSEAPLRGPTRRVLSRWKNCVPGALTLITPALFSPPPPHLTGEEGVVSRDLPPPQPPTARPAAWRGGSALPCAAGRSPAGGC